MSLRRAAIAVGVGGTAFLVASVVGFEVFGGDFPSVFYVLPIAILSWIVAAAGSYRALPTALSRPARSGLVGTAAFSYAFVIQWFVRYSVAATRSYLPFDLIAAVSAVVAIAVGVAAWSRYRPAAGG